MAKALFAQIMHKALGTVPAAARKPNQTRLTFIKLYLSVPTSKIEKYCTMKKAKLLIQ